MPITQPQLEARIANDLVNKYVDGMTWGNVVGGAQGAKPRDRQEVVDALKKRQFDKVGKIFMRLVLEELMAQASDESATMLANGTLSVAEVNRWLGDG